MLTLESLRAWGADVDDGMKRCMNNEAFYLRLIVTGNLALTPIDQPVREITELLRARTQTDYSALLNEILARKQELSDLIG